MKTPQSLIDSFNRFGKNPQGQNVYRVVWSEGRLEWRDGKKRKKYGEQANRWVLEKWCPPTMYFPDSWPEEILGPFPSQGDFEHCYTFETPDGRGISELEVASLADLLVRCIEAGKMHTRSTRWAAIKEAQEKREAAEKQRFDDIWAEAQGPFGGNAVSGVPSKRRPEDVKVNLTTKDVEKLRLPKRGLKQL